jgi:hypothetical protein
VQVDVKDGLPCVAIGVEDRPESALGNSAFCGNPRCPPHHLADNPVVAALEIGKAGDVPLWHDQDVRGHLRVDVVEGEKAVVLVHDRRGDFAFDDFAE